MRPSQNTNKFERLLGLALAMVFVGATFYGYMMLHPKQAPIKPVAITEQIRSSYIPHDSDEKAQSGLPLYQLGSAALDKVDRLLVEGSSQGLEPTDVELGIQHVANSSHMRPTALGTPKIDVQAHMAKLGVDAHNRKLKTPYNLGSYGCAAAIWEYTVKPSLKLAYPEKAASVPNEISHTQTFLNYYRTNKLGKVSYVTSFDLTPDKTPPGTVLIGIKKGTGDHHMLVAVDIDWGSVTNPKTGEKVILKKDGITDAYAGNTGLPQFGAPHFRIQEFAPHLGFLNDHHGAINSLSDQNYYDRFIVMTFAP